MINLTSCEIATHSKQQSVYWKADSDSTCRKITRLLWKHKVHYRFHSSSPLLRIMSWMNPHYFFNIHFNIILSSSPESSKWCLPFILSRLKFYTYFSSPCVLHVLTNYSSNSEWNPEYVTLWDTSVLIIDFRFCFPRVATVIPPASTWVSGLHKVSHPTGLRVTLSCSLEDRCKPDALVKVHCGALLLTVSTTWLRAPVWDSWPYFYFITGSLLCFMTAQVQSSNVGS
jgi:hypothetical protein